jgi:ankyrin repeat protein
MELIEACRCGNVSEVKRLLETEKYCVNNDQQKMNPENIVKLSKRWRAGANKYDDASPLINACYYDQIEVVKYLLSRDDVLVNECFHYSLSPLHIAVFYVKNIEMVKILLSHKQIYSTRTYNNFNDDKTEKDQTSIKILELLKNHQKNHQNLLDN